MQEFDALIIPVYFGTALRYKTYCDAACNQLQVVISCIHIMDMLHLDILSKADVERIFILCFAFEEYERQVVHHTDRD